MTPNQHPPATPGQPLTLPLATAPTRYSADPDPARYAFAEPIAYRTAGFGAPADSYPGTQRSSFPVAEDPATAWLTDRQKTHKLALEDVIGQVRERVEIYTRRVSEIEQAKCAAFNTAFSWHLPAEQPPDAFDPQLHQLLQDLYRERRDERARLWSDLSRLRSALPETLQTYLTTYRQRALLADRPGDAP